jgi:hypothetical protein
VSAFNIYRGSAKGNESPTPYASHVPTPTPDAISSVGAPDGITGITTYVGTFANGAGNALAGVNTTITGFTHAPNNGATIMVVGSTATTLLVHNPGSVVESASASSLMYPYFTDTGVLPGHVYSYEITAISGGAESADSLGILAPAVPFGPVPAVVNVGVASSFEILAGSTVTNTGTTTATGDVGVYPGTTITGFGPPSAITGAFHLADFVAAAGQSALTLAYNDAQARTGAVTLSGDIGGQTLLPGVYNSASSLAITGILYLDAQGNPDATWIFQIGSTLTTAVGNSAVVMLNGGQAANVFWAVGSSATLNGGTRFQGTIMAQASISVAAGVDISGRLLARTGAVTLIGDTINLFLNASLGLYAANEVVPLGDVIFDSVSQSYQQAIIAGTTGATRPTFSPIVGVTTQDGTVLWASLDPPTVVLALPLPPGPPNVPPAPPAAPTNPRIASEL